MKIYSKLYKLVEKRQRPTWIHAEMPSIFIQANLQINMEVSITDVCINFGCNHHGDLPKTLLLETTVNIPSFLGLSKVE